MRCVIRCLRIHHEDDEESAIGWERKEMNDPVKMARRLHDLGKRGDRVEEGEENIMRDKTICQRQICIEGERKEITGIEHTLESSSSLLFALSRLLRSTWLCGV